MSRLGKAMTAVRYALAILRKKSRGVCNNLLPLNICRSFQV